MNIKIITEGTFVELNRCLKKFDINSFQVESYYREKSFYFDLGFENAAEHKIFPKCGLFSPSKYDTEFFDTSFNFYQDNHSLSIKRQPRFFVFLLPFPNFLRTNLSNGSKSIDWVHNHKPFETNKHSQMDNKERYSQRSFYSDITGRLEIIRIDFKKEFNPRINNFLNNNCYPVFVEDAEEVILLMNDYNAFIMGVYGVELTLSSFSKILIPFFELDEQDIQGISKEKPDLLPF